jgi:hypothetical protein
MLSMSTIRWFAVAAVECMLVLLLGFALAPHAASAAEDKPATPPAGGAAAKDSGAPAEQSAPQSSADPEVSSEPPAKKLAADPPGMTRLSKKFDVWVDMKKKRVVFDGAVCLREGYLEMFVCPRHTKEHESIIAVDLEANIVHAGLLAIGAKPGAPAKWQPKYEPASGTPIDITLIWTDEKGVVHRDAAQDWIRSNKTQKALDSTWVFAGSSMGVGPDNQPRYRADDGDFICVSNFPDAMLDLPVESSDTNTERTFEAFTEHVPPKGTRVRLVLTPRPEKAAAATEPAAPAKTEPATPAQ